MRERILTQIAALWTSGSIFFWTKCFLHFWQDFLKSLLFIFRTKFKKLQQTTLFPVYVKSFPDKNAESEIQKEKEFGHA